jgi:hypothetical protein
MKLCLATAGLAVALSLSPSPVQAQLGSGWTEYNPVERVQTRGCGVYNTSNGVETFGLSCGDTSGDNRAEERVENDYSSGTNQFQGEVRVVSLGGSNVSLKQTFMPNNGAFLMLAVASPGRLYSVGDPADVATLATDIVGRWVRINTIHDVAAGTHEIHVDGVLKFVKRGGRPVAWHDKYGTYRLGSGRGPISAEWRNVTYWRGGRGTGGTPQPSPAGDAGSSDVGGSGDAMSVGDPDAAGATGGSGGAGGAGGSGGTGGSSGGGAGGSGGTGGNGGATGGSGSGGSGTGGGSGGSTGARGGTSPRPDAQATGGSGSPAKAGGCSFGGARPGAPSGAVPGAALAVLGLFLVAPLTRRRLRR